MSPRLLPPLLALFAALLSSERALAYCLEKTCNPSDPEQECVSDGSCVLTGQPLRWPTSCVTFDVQAQGSPKAGIDAERATDAALRAFSAWMHADCGGEQPSIRVGTRGPVACDESRYNENGKNANIVVFRDEAWPYGEDVDSFGYTFVRFNTTTGEIYDADVEINADTVELALDGDGDGADLQSILTHEFGHFLGIAHTDDGNDDATMRGDWDGKGTELRTLTSDDAHAICEAYPPERHAGTSCEPKNGFSGECFEPVAPLASAACSSVAGARTGSTLGYGLAPLVALALLRRRSARHSRHREPSVRRR